MMHTTHGAMTAADYADHLELHDQHRHPGCLGHDDGPGDTLSYCTAAMDCVYSPQPDSPEPGIGTNRRLEIYFRQSPTGKLTPAQRRRVMKKAGRGDAYVVLRDEGMGYSAARQGMKQIAYDMPVPVSGAGY